ncbi:hypothetical protein FSOLCH5_009146 [Fusarium solani]|nr:hypothetical protein NW759_010973 [Fusarium solani]
MTTQHAFPYGFLPQAAVMPPAPLPTAPFPQGPMFPSAFLGQPVQMMHVQQPMAVPAYYPPYVPVGYMPINYQAVYNVPNGHYGGPYPPWATDTWNGEMPDTNAQRMAAAEYPVRTQTPYPPRYLPRNGSGFEYTGMASQTPDREHTSFMFEEPGTTNIPGSANRATTGSPRERRRTTREPFESAHSYSHRQQ